MFERQGRSASLCDIEFPQIEPRWNNFQILRLMHGRIEVSVDSTESGKRKQQAILPISRQLQHVQATMKCDDITILLGICLISSMALSHRLSA